MIVKQTISLTSVHSQITDFLDERLRPLSRVVPKRRKAHRRRRLCHLVVAREERPSGVRPQRRHERTRQEMERHAGEDRCVRQGVRGAPVARLGPPLVLLGEPGELSDGAVMESEADRVRLEGLDEEVAVLGNGPLLRAVVALLLERRERHVLGGDRFCRGRHEGQEGEVGGFDMLLIVAVEVIGDSRALHSSVSKFKPTTLMDQAYPVVPKDGIVFVAQDVHHELVKDPSGINQGPCRRREG
jgi:hypothetical protein